MVVYDMMIRKKALKIQDRLGMRIGLMYGTKSIPVAKTRSQVLDVLRDLYRIGLKAYVLPKELFAGIESSTDLYKTAYGDLLKIKDEAKKLNIELILHYPDLSEQPDEILRTFCTISSVMDCRAFIITPNWYKRMPADQALKLVVYKINEIVGDLRSKTQIGIETTGRTADVGDIDDVVDIVKRTTSTEPVINWAHLHARGSGALREQKDFRKVLDYTRNNVGQNWLKNAIFFFSGVSYGPSGEIKHIPLAQSDISLEYMIREIMSLNIKGTLIFEDPEKDKFILNMLDKLADMVR